MALCLHTAEAINSVTDIMTDQIWQIAMLTGQMNEGEPVSGYCNTSEFWSFFKVISIGIDCQKVE